MAKGFIIKLTNKQLLFCNEYLADFNGTQAAIRAGYSKKTARQIAVENLSKPVIKQYISNRVKSKLNDIESRQFRVIEELEKIAFGEVEMSPNDNGAMSPVSNDFKDKIKALYLLGKSATLFVDKIEHSGDVNFNVNIKRSSKRIKK